MPATIANAVMRHGRFSYLAILTPTAVAPNPLSMPISRRYASLKRLVCSPCKRSVMSDFGIPYTYSRANHSINPLACSGGSVSILACISSKMGRASADCAASLASRWAR